MTDIKLINLSKIYGKGDNKVVALDSIDLSITQGEFIAIRGVSGSGKSTLLNIIGCLDRQSEGTYLLGDIDIQNANDKQLAKNRCEHFGFIIQHFALINSYSVYENIEVAIEYSNNNQNKIARVKAILEKLGIQDKIEAKANELSGGQAQRVAIARALINDPSIILADEPTGALDNKTTKEIMQLLTDLNKEGKTVIIVTHDNEVAGYCSRIINLNDGRIID